MTDIAVQKAIELISAIRLPEAATLSVSSILKSSSFAAFFSAYEPQCQQLTNPETAERAFTELDAAIQNEPNSGFVWLALSLYMAANCTANLYREKNIPERVFIDSMGCFCRFVQEHNQSFGVYGFDRAFWTYRFLDATLFRIGTLEYELCIKDKRPASGVEADTIPSGSYFVYMHIPSDARLTPDLCRASYDAAVQFMKDFFPKYSTCLYFTETWLLSPALQTLLPPESNIRRFANSFMLTKEDFSADDYIQWVFKTADKNPLHWAEKTSLQRSIKQFVLNGGSIGNMGGILQSF